MPNAFNNTNIGLINFPEQPTVSEILLIINHTKVNSFTPNLIIFKIQSNCFLLIGIRNQNDVILGVKSKFSNDCRFISQ